MSTLNQLVAAIGATEAAFVRLCRLRALALLGDESLKAKATRAKGVVDAIEAATALSEFLRRYYQVKPGAVCWSETGHPTAIGILSNRQLDRARLDDEIRCCESEIGASLSWLLREAEGATLLSSALSVIEHVASYAPQAEPKEPAPLETVSPPGRGTKVLEGPVETGFDPAFEPTFSLLQAPLPGFGETAKEVAPYFWALAVRESLAAELCALSIAEYDGLPLNFYRDLAKQCWDEMRHSTFFFDAAVEQLDDLERMLDATDPLLENIHRFRREGKGLPIPKERNLYEAILNASLIERLILLHRDTETPGIARIHEKIQGAYCRAHPEMAEALRVVMRDEVTHAQLGKVWLEHLLPESDVRSEMIEETELLRGVRLLASFAHRGEDSLSTLMVRYASGETAPQSAIQVS